MTGRWKRLTTVLMGTTFLAAMGSGCVSKQKFDEAVAASTRAHEALTKCQGILQQAREENDRLKAEMGDRDGAIKTRDARIAELQTSNDDLAKKFKDLYALYEELSKGRKPQPLGTVVLPAKLNAALQKLAAENPDFMEFKPEYGMIKLKSDLTFTKGSADVEPAATAPLKKVAEIMNTDEAKGFNLYVAGHTDDIPLKVPATIEKHGSNWGLSLHRAGAVVKVLAEAGVAQERMAAMGFSKYHPIAPNAANEGGNPINRRVELWVLPPDRFLTAKMAAE